MLNEFELTAQAVRLPKEEFYYIDPITRHLEFSIKVDGNRVCPELVIVLNNLIDSAAKDHDEIHIFSCGCGVPGCVGIWHGISISISDELISWTNIDYYVWGEKADPMPQSCQFSLIAYHQSLSNAMNSVKDLENSLGDSLIVDHLFGIRQAYHSHFGTELSIANFGG